MAAISPSPRMGRAGAGTCFAQGACNLGNRVNNPGPRVGTGLGARGMLISTGRARTVQFIRFSCYTWQM